MTLRRDRLPNKLWRDLCGDDQYLEPTPQREACWLVTLTCTVLGMAGVCAFCWVVGGAEQLADILFR